MASTAQRPAWTTPPPTLDHALAMLHAAGFLKRRDLSADTIAALAALPHVVCMDVLECFQRACMAGPVPSKW